MGATGPTLTTPTPTVTYQDIGLVLKITPTVHDATEMSLDIDAGFTTLGANASGSNIPAIQQRKYPGQSAASRRRMGGACGPRANHRRLHQQRNRGPGQHSDPGTLVSHGHHWRRSSDQTLIVLKPRLINLPPWEFPVTTHAGRHRRPADLDFINRDPVALSNTLLATFSMGVLASDMGGSAASDFRPGPRGRQLASSDNRASMASSAGPGIDAQAGVFQESAIPPRPLLNITVLPIPIMRIAMPEVSPAAAGKRRLR